MKIPLIIFLMTFSQMTYSNPLIGNWKSDKEKTLLEVRKVANIPEKVRSYLEDDLFGKLEIIFTKNKIYTEFDDIKYEGTYEVINQTDNSITIKTWNKFFSEYENYTYYFDGESMYGLTTDYNIKEYFKKIK